MGSRPRVHSLPFRILRAVVSIALALAGVLLAAAPVLAQGEYRIGPQDVLSVTVWGQPELSGRFPVGAGGTVDFPLVGPLTAGGRTPADLQNDLAGRLKDRFVKNPQVTVSVEQFRSQQVFVVGEVQRAGAYPMSGPMTLLEALAHAGSTGPRAGPQAIVIHPASGDRAAAPTAPGDAAAGEVVTVELDGLSRGDLRQNVALRPGDTVLVPRGETVFVLGEVRSPGEYALRRADTSVLQVIALAGGLTPSGTMRRLRIVRREGSVSHELKVTANDPIKPGDTVIVAERVF